MTLEGLNENDIVISGVGCSLPDMKNMHDVAACLFDGKSAIKHDVSQVPAGYYGQFPEHHGHIPDPWKCDCTFFGISKPVARSMDPMVRKILERTFEALVDAGINPAELKGTNSSFFSGTTFSDYDLEWDRHFRGGYGIMGRNRCMNANRISYWLDTKGTSVATDSNWANGLVNLELAWNAIKNGLCDVAVVNGANVTYHYELQIQVRDMGVLSKDGKTKAFDNSADGYVRSDAIAVLVLQRASVAKRCYATVEHVFSQSFGNPENQYALSSEKQWTDFLEAFYKNSKIDPKKVSYYEANGTAVRDEDAKELNAVTKVLCKDRSDELFIGSVKTNVGHSEAASALVGIIKAIICAERMELPKTLYYSEPNQLVPGLLSGKLKPVTENSPLPEDGLIAISAYGVGGVYGHAVLKPNPKTRRSEYDGIPRLVLIADRLEDSMESLLDKIEAIPYNEEYYSLLHDIHSKKIGNYRGRGYTIIPKKEDAVYREAAGFNDEKRPVWFIFSGMGSQWNGMGKVLMKLPLFRESIERSAEVLKKKDVDLIHIVTTDDTSVFDNILHAFVGIAATQIALVDILRALKIEPDGIIGHSVGELGCAYADGGLTAEQMILCAYYRGLASIESELIPGYMAAIGKGYNEIKDDLPPEIDVACHNAKDSCTLSGPAEIVKETVEKLKADKVFAKTVNVANIAYHSRYIAPVAPRLLKYLQTVITDPKPRSSKWISTSNLEEEWGTEIAKYCSPEYHTKNLTNSVLFEEGSSHIPSDAICIEIAPHGLLQAILKRSLDPNCINIPMTRRAAEDPFIFLLQAIGKMYLAGMHPRVGKLYRQIEYPVPRGTPSLTDLVHWNLEYEFVPTFRVIKKTEHSIKEVLHKTNPDNMGCIIGEKSVYPVSIYIRLAWEKAAMYVNRRPEEYTPVITNLRFDKPFHILTTDLTTDLTIMINTGTRYVEISHKEIICNLNIHSELQQAITIEVEDEPIIQALTRGEIYSELEHRGYGYSRPFQPLERVVIYQSAWKGYVSASADWAQKLEAMIQLVILREGEQSQALLFPVSIRRVMIDPQEHLKAMESEALLEIVYSIAHRAVKCVGIEISELRLRQLDPPKSTLSFEVNHFVPYHTDVQTADKFVEKAIHVISSNITAQRKKENSAINVLRVVGLESSQLGAKLGESYSDNENQIHLSAEKFVNDSAMIVDDSVDLVIGDFLSLKHTPLIAGKNSFVLVRSAEPSTTLPTGYALVMKSKTKDSEELLLLNKIKDFEDDDEFFTISEDELVLINIINNQASKSKTFYLIGYDEPTGGVQSYVKNVEEATSAPIRWLFILDKKAPKFSKTNAVYLEQLRKGMSNNVFLNGEWGFFEKMSFVEKVLDPELDVFKHVCSIGEVFYDYVSVNLETTKQSAEVVTDFSGRLRTGTRIMGVASVKNTSLVHDPYLVWQVPTSWSQNDAATVPLPYLMAYYCIIHIGKLKSYEKVLVTDGLTPYGRAAISVALTKAAAVYVTVASEEEKEVITKLFPKLKPNHIFLHEYDDFDCHLGLEVGNENKPQIIVNTLEGDKLEAAMRCLNKLSKLFHLGRNDVEQNRQIATYTFLCYCALFKESGKKLLGLPAGEKEVLLDLVYEGLRSGVVIPFGHETVTMEQVSLFDGWTATDKKMKRLLLDPFSLRKGSNELQIAPGYSYVIIGDTTDVWLDLAESLIQRGADNILIVKSADPKSTSTGRRERCLLQQRQCNLIIHSEKTIRPQVVLKEVQHLGPLAAVFLVSMEKQSNGFESKAAEIDKLWREKTGHFVVISGGQSDLSKLCEARHAAGYPTTNLLWRANEKLIGSHLDVITRLSGRDAVVSVTDSILTHNLVRDAGRVLLESIPNALEDFALLGASLGSDVELIELATAGTTVREAKNLSPLIIIPGLRSDPIHIVTPLARRLKYPLLCTKFPNFGQQSIPFMARAVLEKIKGLHKKKTINIVGISWGCAVSLELTKQLEEAGYNVAVTLIDNPMHTIQQGKLTAKTIESVLLRLLASKSKEPRNDHSPQSWNDGLRYTVNALDLGTEERENILESATYLNNQLRALLGYDFTQLRLKGPLTVLHSRLHANGDYCYTSMCSNVVVRDYPLSQSDLLEADGLTTVLHLLALSDDMILGRIHECSWTEFENFLVMDKAASKLKTQKSQYSYLSVPIEISVEDQNAIIL